MLADHIAKMVFDRWKVGQEGLEGKAWIHMSIFIICAFPELAFFRVKCGFDMV
jgi:hypothetical protein